MYTLSRAITEYLRLSRPDFCENNPHVPVIFSCAATALASRMSYIVWDRNPATFFIALIGPIRTGKSSFIREYLRLFRGTGIGEIPIGSPESVLESIDAVRHGWMWYDEIGDLMKKLDSYMGPLLPLLNKVYYLDGLSHTRTKGRGVVIDPESYFVHAYFSGTPKDWSMIEKKAIGGFVRRVLVLNVNKHIPFFSGRRPSEEVVQFRSRLYALINAILKALAKTEIWVHLPPYSELGEPLEKARISLEKKSMVEEYFYKVIASYIVANLITFDVNEDPESIDTNEVIHRMQRNGVKFDIDVSVEGNTPTKALVVVRVPEPRDDDSDVTLDDFMPPNYHRVVFNLLLNAVKPGVSAPEETIADNITKIKEWLESGGDVVVSKRTFVREILTLRKANEYEPVIGVLLDAGCIRMVDYIYRGRNVTYVVLDLKAKICANCARYRTSECPRIAHLFVAYQHDPDSLRDVVISRTPPWDKPCEKFELAEEPEPEKEGGKND